MICGDRIDLMLARAQIFIAVLLISVTVGLTVFLILYHREMSATVVTIVSSVIAQLVGAMITGVGFFLSRNRQHTTIDPPNATDSPNPPLVPQQETQK